MSEIKTAAERLQNHVEKEKDIPEFFRFTNKEQQLDIYKTAEISDLRDRIKQLEQELANEKELTNQLDLDIGYLNDTINEKRKEISDLYEELAEAKKDQARYRWIVRDFDTAKMKLEDYLYTDFESLDDFIDSAIKESK